MFEPNLEWKRLTEQNKQNDALDPEMIFRLKRSIRKAIVGYDWAIYKFNILDSGHAIEEKLIGSNFAIGKQVNLRLKSNKTLTKILTNKTEDFTISLLNLWGSEGLSTFPLAIAWLWCYALSIITNILN